MNLKNIMVGLKGLKAKGNLEQEIIGIESNSKNVKNGYLFVAVKGFNVDGHDFIESAIENGATAIAVEEGFDLKSVKFPKDMTIIIRNNKEKRK